jgi:hypothetical protein
MLYDVLTYSSSNMQALTKPVNRRHNRKLNKDGLMLSLTPAIIAWCDEQLERENIYRSRWIEEAVLDCHNSKSTMKGLEALQDGKGRYLKSNKNRWGEKKRPCKVYLHATTIEILQNLSDKTSVSKSECVEYILRAITDAT